MSRAEELDGGKAQNNSSSTEESRLLRVEEFAHIGHWQFSLDDRILVSSDEMNRIYGYDPETHQMTLDEGIKACHPDDLEKVQSAFEKAIETGEGFDYEHRIVRLDGAIRTISAKTECRLDDTGEVTSLLGIIQDITDRKLADDARVESDQIFRAISESAPVAVAISDLSDGTYLYCNDKVSELLGLPPGTVVGRKASEFFIEPDEREEFVQQIREDGELQASEIQLRRADGTTVWGIGSAQLINFGGRPANLSAVVDITDRKKAEDALRESDERYALAMEGTNEALWDWEIATDTLHMSPRYQELIGLKNCSSIKSESWMQYIHPDDRELFRDSIKAHLREETAFFSCEFRLQVAGLPDRWVRDRGMSLRDVHGCAYRMAGSMGDITDRKLVETALFEAKEAAEKANLAKSDFLSSMSHELRTPLNAILGFAELIRTDEKHILNKEHVESVDHILHSGGHLLELINEVLDLARVEAGKVSLDLCPLPVRSHMLKCIDLVASVASEKKVTIDASDVATTSTCVQADELRFKQVCLNLLSNAIKYNMEAGKIFVSSKVDDRGFVHIAIKDTGYGISDEDKGSLFQPFSRVGKRSENIEGTGLGLALAKRLVEEMGGEIGFESTAGHGSTFWFILPQGAGTSATDAQLPKKTSNVRKLNKNSQILCIEDNDVNMRLVEKLIQRHGDAHLLVASTAEEGLNILENNSIDVVLMDVSLPGMDGISATQRIKSNPKTKDIPVVIISANAMEDDVQLGLQAGANDYLTKPLKTKMFLKVLSRVLEERAK